MPRIKGVDAEKEILELFIDGKPRPMREVRESIGRWQYTVYYHLRDKVNNLVRRGCLEEVKTVGELKHRAQDEYVFKPGKNFEACLRGEK